VCWVGDASGGVVDDDYYRMSSHPRGKVPKRAECDIARNLLRWLSTGDDSLPVGKFRGLVDQSVEQLC
jgi:hypothetical protein